MKTIEFASEEVNNTSPWDQPRGDKNNDNNSYEDLVLKPEYAKRRLRFDAGQTWFRIVPAVAGSTHGWMMRLHVLNFARGHFSHPRTLKPNAKSVFDHAYAWALENAPAGLYSKNNKEGVRLLADPMRLFWALIEREGKYVARLVYLSGYDGSRGGAPGLGWKIWNLCYERDEIGARIADVVSPEKGVLVSVEKNQPKGSKYPSYHLTLGRNPKPMSELLTQMDPEEIDALCPLEHTVRELSDEEQWQCLAKIMAPSTAAQIRESLGHPNVNS